MSYVFDTSSFVVVGHYFPQRFPSFWKNFDASVRAGEVLSCREVYNELKGKGNKPHLDDWVEANKKVFQAPTSKETAFVGTIFAVPHFQQLVSEQQRLKGVPVADPFVIASAKIRNSCVVTEEATKPGAARIPNVCEHFSIACCNLEAFMERQGWRF